MGRNGGDDKGEEEFVKFPHFLKTSNLMVSDADLIELIKCKYLANAEYLKSVLEDKNIYAEINFDDHSITVNRSNLKEAKELISKEDLDETETIDQENFMEGYRLLALTPNRPRPVGADPILPPNKHLWLVKINEVYQLTYVGHALQPIAPAA